MRVVVLGQHRPSAMSPNVTAPLMLMGSGAWERLIAPIGRFAIGAADPFLVFAGDSLDPLPI
jgi:hypothetical protein